MRVREAPASSYVGAICKRLSATSRRGDANGRALIVMAKDGNDEDWVIPGPRRGKKVAAVAAVCVVVVAALYYGVPVAEGIIFPGPAPVWHTFLSVFNTNEIEVSGACSLQDTVSVLGLPTSDLGPHTTVSCSYRGQSYIGDVSTDCDLQGTGTILSVSGTLVPYLGCRLSYAPFLMTFSGLYTLAGQGNDSVHVYQGDAILANLTLVSNLRSEGCSYQDAASARTNGIFVCTYLGIPYTTPSVLQDCNLGTPIQVSGIPAPTGGCVFQRNELYTAQSTSSSSEA